MLTVTWDSAERQGGPRVWDSSIFDRATMVDALHVAGLERSENGYVRCPSGNHSDRNASLNILDKTTRRPGRAFYCHACGAKGGVADFLVLVGKAQDRAHAARLL